MKDANVIQQHLDERVKLIAEARTVADIAVKENRPMTGEEQAKFNKLNAAAAELNTTVKGLKELEAIELELAKPQGRKVDAGNPGAPKAEKYLATPEYKAAFMDFLRGDKTAVSSFMKEQKAFYQDLPQAGGYLVAEEMLNYITAALKNLVWVRGLATVIPLNGAISLGCPTLASEPNDADWTGEISPAVSEDTGMAFGKRELKPHLSSKLVKFSRLLLQNAPNAESFVSDRLAYKFGVTEEKAFLTGSGSGQPLGVFTASADGINTDRDISTGNTATAMTWDGIIRARQNIKAQYRKKAAWVFHRDGITQLMLVKDGLGRYLWNPSVSVDKPDTILANPCYESEYVPNTFTASKYVGLFGDFSYYYIADVNAYEVQTLVEKYAEYNQIGLIARKYTDGMPAISEAFSRVKLAA